MCTYCCKMFWPQNSLWFRKLLGVNFFGDRRRRKKLKVTISRLWYDKSRGGSSFWIWRVNWIWEASAPLPQCRTASGQETWISLKHVDSRGVFCGHRASAQQRSVQLVLPCSGTSSISSSAADHAGLPASFCKNRRLKVRIALHGNPSQSYGASLTLHLHSVTCHPTQVNAPHHNPSQPGPYSIYLPRRDGRLSWPLGIKLTTAWSQVRCPNRYATKSPITNQQSQQCTDGFFAIISSGVILG